MLLMKLMIKWNQWNNEHHAYDAVFNHPDIAAINSGWISFTHKKHVRMIYSVWSVSYKSWFVFLFSR